MYRLHLSLLTLGLYLIACATATTVAAQSVPSPDHPEWAAALKAAGTPITVYTAKKIYTMDPGRPEANAIAVLDGTVLSTGTMESMEPWLSRYKYTVKSTLKDKIILPGPAFAYGYAFMSPRPRLDPGHLLSRLIEPALMTL